MIEDLQKKIASTITTMAISIDPERDTDMMKDLHDRLFSFDAMISYYMIELNRQRKRSNS